MIDYSIGSIHGPYKRRRWFRKQRPALPFGDEPRGFFEWLGWKLSKVFGGQ